MRIFANVLEFMINPQNLLKRFGDQFETTFKIMINTEES